MQISQAECIGESDLSQQDLLSYLSQVVLTLIDEEAQRKHETLGEWKNKAQTLKVELTKEKEKLQGYSSELSRQKALGRVLSILKSLKSQGVLSGQNGRKIIKVLETIDSKDFHALRILEERLGAYLPDK